MRRMEISGGAVGGRWRRGGPRVRLTGPVCEQVIGATLDCAAVGEVLVINLGTPRGAFRPVELSLELAAAPGQTGALSAACDAAVGGLAFASHNPWRTEGCAVTVLIDRWRGGLPQGVAYGTLRHGGDGPLTTPVQLTAWFGGADPARGVPPVERPPQ